VGFYHSEDWQGLLKIKHPSILFILICICTGANLALFKEGLATSQGEPVSASVLIVPTLISPQPKVTVIVTPQRCSQTKGRIEIGNFYTHLLTQVLQYRVYLPPCYDQDWPRRYPVLYLIHGQSYNDDQWDRLGADETADDLISSGEVPPFIIVMPQDRIWSQPDQDPFGQVMVDELIPWIDDHYRTLTDRQNRAIGGLSRGGGWALHLGLSRWDLFNAIGLHSAAIFESDSAQIPRWLDKISPESMPHIYIDIGERDRPQILSAIRSFEEYLTRLGIPHLWHLYTGYHNEAYWKSHLEDYLRWYASNWKSSK